MGKGLAAEGAWTDPGDALAPRDPTVLPRESMLCEMEKQGESGVQAARQSATAPLSVG